MLSKRAGSDKMVAFVNRCTFCWLAGIIDRCIWIMDYNDSRYHVDKTIIDYDYDVKSSRMKHACPPRCILIQLAASLLRKSLNMFVTLQK